MKKEDFVSALVMTTVSILMLVGVTIAWYTNVYAHPTVTQMKMTADEQGRIKVALEEMGPDIAELEGDAKYVEIGWDDFLNIENKQIAPGSYGKVVFYVTSLKKSVDSCLIVPSLNPGYEEGVEVLENSSVSINNLEKNIVTMLEEHFDFYEDEAMTQSVDKIEPMKVELEWNESQDPEQNNQGHGVEKEVTLYWKWHYEDPVAETMEAGDEKEAAIYDYDMEDTWIGTHLDTMSFHFDFVIQ